MRRAESLVAQLIESLDAPMVLDGLHLRAPATIGIAIAPDDADSTRELLRHADAALPRAKDTSVRWVRFTAEQDNACDHLTWPHFCPRSA